MPKQTIHAAKGQIAFLMKGPAPALCRVLSALLLAVACAYLLVRCAAGPVPA